MKKYLLLTAVFLASVFSMRARDFTDPGNAYEAHEVVYVAFKLPSGNLLGSVNGQYSTPKLGAFVDGECRAVAEQETAGTTTAVYLFTLSIGVTDADAGKTVTLALKCDDAEYTFETNLRLTGSEGTLAGNFPSNPYLVTFNPVESVSASERIDINMGETLDLMTVMKFVGKEADAGATMPDAINWDFSNSSEYFTVENNVLNPVKPNIEGRYLGYSFSTGANSIIGGFTVYVHQPITGIAINTTDYPDATITVNEGEIQELNARLADVVEITPSDATESVEWKLTEGDAAGLVLENGKWNPQTKGTYKMQASAPNVTPVDVTVIVLKPAMRLIQSITELNVIVGDEVTQYLPYTFTISPEDASHQFDYVTYEIPEGTTDNYLVKNGDGTITAKAAGTATINIKHADLESTYQVTINVKDFPKADDYAIIADPLSISLKSSELSTLDLTNALTSNVSLNSAFMKISFPSAFTFAEENETSILEQSATTSGITAKAYGSTTVKWTYSVKAAKLETSETAGTTLNEGAPYVATISYALNIVEGLNSIDVLGVVAGLTDGDVVLKLVTNPENIILKEEDIAWNLSDQNNLNDGPVFELGTRVEGKNEWNVTPLRICNNAVIGLEYSDKAVQVDTAKVIITQRLILKDGWSWPSLYAGGIDEQTFITFFRDDVQAVRSRSEITYNDPTYGFFGKLKTMTTDQGYKMQIKDGSTLNVLVPNDGSYTNSAERSVTLDPLWNWVANPYCFAHSLSDVFGGVTLAADSEIRSKNNGFATYTGTGWEGSLTTIEPGETYLIYNAGEQVSASLPAENSFAQTSTSEVSGQQEEIYGNTKSVWEYDGSRFADNMSIIAKGTSALEPNRYSIGAFVAGECRGEGKMVGERFYITVHGATGDKIELKLYDKIANEIIDLANVLNFASSAGTYSQPYPIDTNNVSGINGVNADGGVAVSIDGDNIVVCGAEEGDVKVYNACGMQVPAIGISSGVYLVKINTPQGVVTKKIIKK